VREILPAQAREVGFHAFLASSFETSLWRPFGSRRIRGISLDDPPGEMARRGLQYVVIGTESPKTMIGGQPFEKWFENWLTAQDGTVIGTANIPLLASQGTSTWYVARIREQMRTKKL
jgi:hypothetical protein